MAVAMEDFRSELQRAREILYKVDKNIKKISGRDPTEARNAKFTWNMVIWNVHGEFNLSCRNKLEDNQLAISDVEEKSIRLINNESKLRRNLEEKDHLLASKAKELDDLRVQFDQQKKVIEDLSTQVNDMDRIKEEALQKLAAPRFDNEQQTAPASVIPVELAILEEPNVSSLPETEVGPTDGERDGSTFVLEEPVSPPAVVEQFQPSEASASVKPSVLVVRSDIMHKSTDNSIIVIGIPTWQIGLVIGQRGRNMLRLERGYGVKLSFAKGTLYITGGDQTRRQAALKDVIENLPVVVECPLLPLENHNRISNLLLKEMCQNYDVKISRPSAENKIGIISGRIDRCRTVYHLLNNAHAMTLPHGNNPKGLVDDLVNGEFVSLACTGTVGYFALYTLNYMGKHESVVPS
uniref:K Homology domain-containing protein n=1 Tax=Daphnia galeata TaxID=27404 RepID=A0A8J2RZ05_9CRUS|nr:unnamed protein product [Daphnia galeata]